MITKKISAEFDISFEEKQIPPDHMVKLLHDYLAMLRFTNAVIRVDAYPLHTRLVVTDVALPEGWPTQ